MEIPGFGNDSDSEGANGLLSSQNRGALREVPSQKPTKIIPLQAKDQSAIVWLKNGKSEKKSFIMVILICRNRLVICILTQA
jgi:adenine C2-methylase RlmN of 23S rRNA A2503 and tRNA A37